MLAYNNLDGTLPSNIWKIRNLLSLCAPGNPNLRGRIADFLFGNMSKLITASISSTSIGGDIPEDFAKLSMLQNFLGCPMNGNGFSGRLPDDIGNMTELRLVCLGDLCKLKLGKYQEVLLALESCLILICKIVLPARCMET